MGAGIVGPQSASGPISGILRPPNSAPWQHDDAQREECLALFLFISNTLGLQLGMKWWSCRHKHANHVPTFPPRPKCRVCPQPPRLGAGGGFALEEILKDPSPVSQRCRGVSIIFEFLEHSRSVKESEKNRFQTGPPCGISITSTPASRPQPRDQHRPNLSAFEHPPALLS